MVHWLDQSDARFEGEFQAFLSLKREASVDVDTAVAEIIDAVRAGWVRTAERHAPFMSEGAPQIEAFDTQDLVDRNV